MYSIYNTKKTLDTDIVFAAPLVFVASSMQQSDWPFYNTKLHHSSPLAIAEETLWLLQWPMGPIQHAPLPYLAFSATCLPLTGLCSSTQASVVHI